jgi:PAS domain S-box-containing protein
MTTSSSLHPKDLLSVLQVSESTNRVMLEEIPDLFLQLQRDGTCLENINPGIETGKYLPISNHISEILPAELVQKLLKIIEEEIATRKLQVYEHSFLKQDRRIYQEVRILAINDHEVLAIIRDISDRKQAEEATRLSEERLQFALEASGDGLWDWNVTTGDLYLSSLWAEMLGFQLDELPANISVWEKLVHPDDKPWVMELLNAHLEDGAVPYKFDYRLQAKTGEYRWIANFGKVVVRDRQGKPLRMIGTHRDISVRKHSEEQLRNSEAHLKTAQRIGKLGNWEFELKTGKISWSDEVFRIYGRDPALGVPTYEELQQYFHPEDWEHFDRTFHTSISLAQPYNFEHRICRPDGALIYVIIRGEIICNTLGQPIQIVGTVLDVTALKQAEAALRQLNQDLEHRVKRRTAALNLSQSSLLEAQKVAKLGSWHLNVANQKLTWTAEVFKIFGLDPNQPEPNYEEMLSYYPVDERKRVIDMVDRAIQGSPYELDSQIIRADGSSMYTFVRAEPIWDEAGKVIDLFGIVMDISDRKLVELELQKTMERLALALKSGAIGYWEWNIQQNIFFWDDQMHELYGLRKEKDLPIVYEIWAGALHPDDRAASEMKVQQIAAGQLEEYRAEFRVIHPDDSIYFIKAYGALKRDASGNPVSITGINFDITERKQAEQTILQQANREALLRGINQRIRQSLDLPIIFDTACQEIQQLLQCDRVGIFKFYPESNFDDGEFVAESVADGFSSAMEVHIHDHCFGENYAAAYAQGRVQIVNDIDNAGLTDCHRDVLAQFQVQANLVIPLLYGNSLWGLLCIHQCATTRQWQEHEINLIQQIANQLAIAIQQASLFERLQQELAERQQAEAKLTDSNQQLAISNQELSRATRMKDEFLANMSHELRTPLNAILGMTEGLQERVFGEVNEEQIKALQTVERSGSHLLELIDDILDMAKIEAGQISLECTPISISYICQSSLAFIKQQAFQKRIQVEIKLQPNLPELLVDERRIRQVLINLLNNALKFTPEGGNITLEVTNICSEQVPVIPSQQCFVNIAVIDTGIGISAENIKKLFHPFVQIDSALNRQYNGTGLGLALVKKIVELHGGSVELSSELGVGSCFTIKLPCTPGFRLLPGITLGDPRLEPMSVNESASHASILLADDDEANISTFSSYLKAKGYRILVAKNGREAIALAKAHQPDLILMDIQMPVMDGLEATMQIRLDPNLIEIPIIALTALAMTGDRERCLAAGATDYLTKPVKLKQLVTTIHQLLTV